MCFFKHHSRLFSKRVFAYLDTLSSATCIRIFRYHETRRPILESHRRLCRSISMHFFVTLVSPRKNLPDARYVFRRYPGKSFLWPAIQGQSTRNNAVPIRVGVRPDSQQVARLLGWWDHLHDEEISSMTARGRGAERSPASRICRTVFNQAVKFLPDNPFYFTRSFLESYRARDAKSRHERLARRGRRTMQMKVSHVQMLASFLHSGEFGIRYFCWKIFFLHLTLRRDAVRYCRIEV